MASVVLLGVEDATAYLTRLQGAAQTLGKFVAQVGTNVVYGWGQEFGIYRSGRLARKDGGRFYLTGAFADVKPRIAPELRAALLLGPLGMLDALRRLAFDVEAGAKDDVPVLTGNLRRSLHSVINGEAAD